MCRICTQVPPGEPQVFLGPDKAFTYDYVFDTGVGQSTIHETCVARLVEGALDGYNATVLAYGQTGSGKTYTMGTGFDVEVGEAVVGIIPRAIRHLFNGIAEKQQQARERAQMPPEFKVYKEILYTILNPCYFTEINYSTYEWNLIFHKIKCFFYINCFLYVL